MRTDREFLRDLAYGTAVADAMGVPFEFKPRGTFKCTGMTGHGTYNMPVGTFSDDTSLTLATIDSVLHMGCVDVGDMRACFEHWLINGLYTPDGYAFDKGNTTKRAIMEGRGFGGEFDSGNGSLMRIAPLAATDCTDREVGDVSAITHSNDLCKELCVSFVKLLRTVHHEPQRAHNLVTDGGLSERDVLSGGYIVDTYNAALWCFATTDSYRECVLRAVNLGDDTDTVGAVAGALAAACYGYSDIPAEWIEKLRAKELIDDVLAGNAQF